jgi:hypothetical protein
MINIISLIFYLNLSMKILGYCILYIYVRGGPVFIRRPERSTVLWIKTKQTAWSESASELYRPRDRRLSAK